MSGKNLPWSSVPGCVGLQARRYADRVTYRFRQRRGKKLYVHTFGGISNASAIALARILRCTPPARWLESEDEDFWLCRVQSETDWLIFEMQPEVDIEMQPE